MTPDSTNLSSNIIYSANGSNVDTTICDGKILMENKKLVVLDEQEIYDKARQAYRDLIDYLTRDNQVRSCSFIMPKDN